MCIIFIYKSTVYDKNMYPAVRCPFRPEIFTPIKIHVKASTLYSSNFGRGLMSTPPVRVIYGVPRVGRAS